MKDKGTIKSRIMLQNACEALCIVPGPLIKKDAIRIFKDVNQSSRFYNTYFCFRKYILVH